MRFNRILTGLTCMILLAGIGAAVEVLGGNLVYAATGSGGAAGGPYVTSADNSLAGVTTRVLDVGVIARAWAGNKTSGTGGGSGTASATFTGSGSASKLGNLTYGYDQNTSLNDFLQTASWSGTVTAEVNKTSIDKRTIDAWAEISASSIGTGGLKFADNIAGKNIEAYGDAWIFTSIGRHVDDGSYTPPGGKEGKSADKRFNATGTATARATGSASYSTEYLSNTSKDLVVSLTNTRATLIKATGEVSGETYLTAENKANTDPYNKHNGTSGEAYIYTSSKAQFGKGAPVATNQSLSELYAKFNASSLTTGSANIISGFVNATKATSTAWDANRTANAPSSTNYNVYTNVNGVLEGKAKAYEKWDRVNTTAYIFAEAKHALGDTTKAAGYVLDATSGAKVTTQAWGHTNNTTKGVEGSAFINNAVADSIAQGRVGKTTTKNDVKGESSFKTLGSLTPSGAGDNIGGGIYLTHQTRAKPDLNQKGGFNTTATYNQSAAWDNGNTRFKLTTDFNVTNHGLNYTTLAANTGSIGTVMTIKANKMPLVRGTKGTTVASTNITSQKNWNWWAPTNSNSNNGGVFDYPVFDASGVVITNSTIFTRPTFTRKFVTSNPS